MMTPADLLAHMAKDKFLYFDGCLIDMRIMNESIRVSGLPRGKAEDLGCAAADALAEHIGFDREANLFDDMAFNRAVAADEAGARAVLRAVAEKLRAVEG